MEGGQGGARPPGAPAVRRLPVQLVPAFSSGGRGEREPEEESEEAREVEP